MIARDIYETVQSLEPDFNGRQLATMTGTSHSTISKAKKDKGVAQSLAEWLAGYDARYAYLLDESKAELKRRRVKGIAKRNRTYADTRKFSLNDLPRPLQTWVGFIG